VALALTEPRKPTFYPPVKELLLATACGPLPKHGGREVGAQDYLARWQLLAMAFSCHGDHFSNY
jgi:hypothetical protein